MNRFNVPGECPVCKSELKIEKLSCTGCGTQILGSFYVSGFSKLSEKQLEFVKIFIKCKGNIKEMEKELGISYPTVKSRLDEVSTALGLDVEKKEEKSNTEILESVEKGELSIEEAVEIIKKR